MKSTMSRIIRLISTGSCIFTQNEKFYTFFIIIIFDNVNILTFHNTLTQATVCCPHFFVLIYQILVEKIYFFFPSIFDIIAG